MQNNDWLAVGRFGRAHGVKGLISIVSFTEPADNIQSYLPWYIFIKNEYQLLAIERLEKKGHRLLAKMEHFETPEQVSCLTNKDIFIKSQQLPSLPEGEYYWRDLINLEVVNQAHQKLGKVVEVIATGANDVLIIEGERRTLIPFIMGRFVLNIDKTNEVIVVDWELEEEK